jgi:hypothetical protein
MDTSPTITMTSFAGFVAADSVGQLAKVREIKRHYDQPYVPGGDYWSRWRDGIERLHRTSGRPDGIDSLWQQAKDNRADQYKSACEGYRNLWGRRRIVLMGHPKPVRWKHDRLTVKVNPEWKLNIGGKPTVVKLHTERKVTLDQRLANPLLVMLEHCFPNEQVAIIDVHRGKSWTRRSELPDLIPVLRMQAAAFLVGWDQVVAEGRKAA